MKTLLALLLLLICTSLVPARGMPLRADEKESAEDAFKRRPFNEHIEWDEAGVQVGRALRGDAKARAEINKGGLSYVPLILGSRAEGAVAWAFSLLSAHKDWVEEMQRWERLLLRTDASRVLEEYARLKPRFENPDAQLARAIIMAWRLGDMASARALIALAPQSRLVKAACAYACIGYDARTAAETLMLASQELRDVGVKAIEFNPAFWDEDLRELRSNSDEVIKEWQRRLFDLDGVEYLRTLPREWEQGGYIERIGALVRQAGDKKFSDDMAARYAAYCGREYKTDVRYQAFLHAMGASSGIEQRPGAFEVLAGRSNGPILSAWAATRTDPGMELECTLSSISALYGNPDLRAARDFCLEKCLEYPDRQTGLLAMRAVLALRDNCLDGVTSVARALALHPRWSVCAAEFRKALEATRQPKLLALAKQMADGTREFAAVDFSETLDLTPEQRASLLGPFVAPDELAAHGGPLGVYFLNLGIFLEAGGAAFAAAEPFGAAVCEAARISKRKAGNVNSIFWTDFVNRRFGASEEPKLFARLKKSCPELQSIIEAEIKLSESTTAPAEERAFYIARDMVMGGKTAPAEVLKSLVSDLSRGGGMGLSLAAWSSFFEQDYSGRFALMARAELASPLDMDIAYQAGPATERFGWYVGAQWEGPARSALRMVLVQPDHGNSIMRVGQVLAVQGSPSVVVGALFASTARRSVPRFVASQGLSKAHLFRSAYWEASNWFKESMRAWSDEVPNEYHKQCMDMLRLLNWQANSTDTLWYVSDACLRPEFMQRSLDGVMSTHNTNDVNNLLNYSLAIAGHDPARTLMLIQRSEDLGVSDYGHFVGSQGYIRSKAGQGEFTDALKRYQEMRGENVGRPAYLDRYLLMGLTEGNRYSYIDKALEAMADYEWDTRDNEFNFVLRRALMASGHYGDVGKATAPRSDRRNMPFNHCAEYSAAFHEARRLLDAGEFSGLLQRAEVFTETRNLGCVGVCLDAALLQALALKEQGEAAAKPDDKGRIHVLEAGFAQYWLGGEALLDIAVFEVLEGKRAWEDIPAPDTQHFWHGARYGERPSINNGTGFLTAAECEAREPFIRGVLAYLCGNKEKARQHLEACVAKDQRCSHEYHIAQWILEKRLAKPAEEKK